jgi:hypothetical protein
MARQFLPRFVFIGALALFAQVACADLPTITLLTVTPPGGRSGTEVEVTLAGSDLDDASAMYFSHPGITAMPREKKFVVKIAPEVPPGIYDTRVLGKFGLSNPRAFVVGELPETVEAKANDSLESAPELAISSLFNGVIPAATADYLRLPR